MVMRWLGYGNESRSSTLYLNLESSHISSHIVVNWLGVDFKWVHLWHSHLKITRCQPQRVMDDITLVSFSFSFFRFFFDWGGILYTCMDACQLRDPTAPVMRPSTRSGSITTPSMVFSVTTLFTKGLNYTSRGFEVSRPLIANMVSFVNISNYYRQKKNVHCYI